MIQSKLSKEELTKRASEVFDLQEDDCIYDVYAEIDVCINMQETDKSGQTVIFDYKPDMSNRPEALAYLLGLREDFND